MAAVFLSDIDDYLAPSQACVNPIFSTDKEKSKEEEGDEKKQSTTTANNNSNNQVIPRAHRRRNRVNNNRTANNANAAVVVPSAAVSAAAVVPKKQDPNSVGGNKDDDNDDAAKIVKASIVDCLACSGCVTTAETVLLETHSLDILRTKLYPNPSNENNKEENYYVGLTISPASSADLIRRILLYVTTTTNNTNLELLNQQLASMLCRRLNVHAVLDGNLALLWSLQYAAEEFCNAYKKNKRESGSAAGLSNNNIIHHETKQQEQLPIITSSCPALVCLAEKTLHQSVSHLSSIKSPMSMAGSTVWKKKKKNINDDDTSKSNSNTKKRSFYHLAVMPCHDKKLEASRPELLGDVDMVITTEECYQLLKESAVVNNNNNKQNVKEAAAANDGDVDDVLRAELLSSSSSSDSSSAPPQHVRYYDIPPTSSSSSSLIDPESLPKGTYITTTSTATTNGGSDGNETTFFPFSSGGYADYVFRYACQHLFNIEISSGISIWKPGSIDGGGGGGGGGRTSTTKPKFGSTATTSARTAAAAQRRRQLYHATLYRGNLTNGECYYVGSWEQEASGTETSNSKKKLVPVLRFVIAHGMQTMQRALEPFQDSDDVKIKNNVGGKNTSNSSTIRRQQPPPVHSYDYLEAMACPSGCMNGGGQIRSPVIRETPTQTRERVKRTHQCFSSCKCSDSNSDTHGATTAKIEEDNDSLVHTTYRVVQPLQLQMGAAAGVAVKDMQW